MRQQRLAAAPLEHPLGGPGALDSPKATPPHMPIAPILSRLGAKNVFFSPAKPLLAWSMPRIGATCMARRSWFWWSQGAGPLWGRICRWESIAQRKGRSRGAAERRLCPRSQVGHAHAGRQHGGAGAAEAMEADGVLLCRPPLLRQSYTAIAQLYLTYPLDEPP